jgi:carbamoyltransferase
MKQWLTSSGRLVRWYGKLGSTNDEARAWAREGAQEGSTVWAEEQSAGRGRRGAVWLSGPGEGLTFSVILRPSMPRALWPRLALVSGLAVVRVFEGQGLAAELKWPNDVMVKDRKICGILVEAFDDAVIVVLDAIGEWNTSTIWVGEGSKITNRYKANYPFSFGLFYSAFTQLIGLKPNEEEYIMMGMAAYGDPNKYFHKVFDYFPDINSQKYNFHFGIKDWNDQITEQDKFDIAASVQKVYELRLNEFMHFAYKITGKNNLVFMGGCALNSSANTMLWNIFKNIWIMPNPGDAGSSLGAAAAMYGKHLDWKGPYLGTNIPGKYPVTDILNNLKKDGIATVANGRAEYGPRALGNRSILADPRDKNIKDKVNLIKGREMFRPFAPVVLEEFAHEWFDMPKESTSPYMQYTFKCLRPELIPSVVHKDETSRVQTVNKEQHPGLYELLKKWNKYSGVPILLNTSLNIKGQPLLNDIYDRIIFERSLNV